MKNHFNRIFINKCYNKRINFIMIGAFDGSNRFFRRHISWNVSKGVLIEPLPFAFKMLYNQYKKYPNIYFENIMISTPAKSEMILWCDHERPSFSSSYHYVERVATTVNIPVDRITDKTKLTKYVCKAMTVQEIVNKYKFNNLDFIDIDTVGMCYDIIKTIDFNKNPPRLLRYNHAYINKHEPIRYLAKFGYKCLVDRDNTVAWRD